jgi:hypothetical protein
MPAGAARARSPRGGAVARLHRRPRCSAPSGDSTGDQQQLRQAKWGGGVLTGDGQWRWGGENGPTRQRSKAAVELRWPGRASMSPAAGGEDMGGEVRPKRGERRGHGEAHQGGTMARRRDGNSLVSRRGHDVEEREEGATECSSVRLRGRTRGKRKGGGSGDGAPFIDNTTARGGGGAWGWRGGRATRCGRQ